MVYPTINDEIHHSPKRRRLYHTAWETFPEHEPFELALMKQF